MKKVALVFVVLNPPYWQYAKDVITDCREKFLPGHQVDYFLWSDVPEKDSPELETILSQHPTNVQKNDILKKELFDFVTLHPEWDLPTCQMQWNEQNIDRFNEINKLITQETLKENVEYLRGSEFINIIPTEPVGWPYPTLMRYNLFLGEEEKLKEYDYIFYMDVDMRVVDIVGDEILGEGLTMAEHPMYSVRREYVPPYEPNSASTAFINRFGVVIERDGKPCFKPLYAAGGFQGGTATEFIKATKVMRDNINKDFDSNYIAIWNDESHWNKYLSSYTGHFIALSPSYIYPDSLINEYYLKVWGTNYPPKIVTLTKKFSTSKLDGAQVAQRLASM